MNDAPKTPSDGRPVDWRNKPTDRFLLWAIKRYLSAPVTLALRRVPGVTPAAVTVTAAVTAVAAGVILALGWAWQAGCVALVAQVLDGVDGQLARLRGRSSPAGAYLDSVLDRYADGALTLGTAVYVLQTPPWGLPLWALGVVAFLAVVGSAAVSYTAARGAELGFAPGRPTLASKGTRVAVIIICAWLAAVWPPAPALALAYLAVHANGVVAARLVRALKA